VSAYPVVLFGEALTALVVGAGRVGTRKALALLEAGATVRVVAPAISPELRRASAGTRLELVERAYAAGDVGDAQLVLVATNDRAVNAAVAADARGAGRLVNVADVPEEGSFATVAAHRAGDLVVAVFTGGVPTAAIRIRDAIARRFDGRYAQALGRLAALRTRLLAEGESARWRRAAEALVPADFCDAVERGTFEARAAEWR
jgi:siroheme synthase-like protein